MAVTFYLRLKWIYVHKVIFHISWQMLAKIGMILYLGIKINLYPYLSNFYLIWFRSGVRDLHNMLLSLCIICGNLSRDVRTFLMGVNGIAFGCMPWNPLIYVKVNKDLVVPMLYINSCTIVSVVKQCLQLVTGRERPIKGDYMEVQGVGERVILKCQEIWFWYVDWIRIF